MANPAEKPKAEAPKKEVLSPAAQQYLKERYEAIKGGVEFTEAAELAKLQGWLETQGVADAQAREKLAKAGIEDLKNRLRDKSPEKKALDEKSFEKLNQAMDEIYGQSKTGIEFVDKFIDNLTKKGVMKVTGIVALLSLATKYLSEQKDENGEPKHKFLVEQLNKILVKLDPSKEVKDKDGKKKKRKKTPEELRKDNFDALVAFLKLPGREIAFEELTMPKYEALLKKYKDRDTIMAHLSSAIVESGEIGIVQKGIKARKNLDGFKYQLSDINLSQDKANYIAALLQNKEGLKKRDDDKALDATKWTIADCRKFIDSVKKDEGTSFETLLSS